MDGVIKTLSINEQFNLSWVAREALFLCKQIGLKSDFFLDKEKIPYGHHVVVSNDDAQVRVMFLFEAWDAEHYCIVQIAGKELKFRLAPYSVGDVENVIDKIREILRPFLEHVKDSLEEKDGTRPSRA